MGFVEYEENDACVEFVTRRLFSQLSAGLGLGLGGKVSLYVDVPAGFCDITTSLETIMIQYATCASVIWKHKVSFQFSRRHHWVHLLHFYK